MSLIIKKELSLKNLTKNLLISKTKDTLFLNLQTPERTIFPSILKI